MDEIHLAWTKCDPNVLEDPHLTHLRPSGTMELSIYREYNYIYFKDVWTHYNALQHVHVRHAMYHFSISSHHIMHGPVNNTS